MNIDILWQLRTLLNSDADLHGAMKSGNVTAEQITCSSSSSSKTDINLASLNLTSVNLSASARTDSDRHFITYKVTNVSFYSKFWTRTVAVIRIFFHYPKFSDPSMHAVCSREETTVILNISEGGRVCGREVWEPSSPAQGRGGARPYTNLASVPGLWVIDQRICMHKHVEKAWNSGPQGYCAATIRRQRFCTVTRVLNVMHQL